VYVVQMGGSTRLIGVPTTWDRAHEGSVVESPVRETTYSTESHPAATMALEARATMEQAGNHGSSTFTVSGPSALSDLATLA
jgi:hypothetical protein